MAEAAALPGGPADGMAQPVPALPVAHRGAGIDSRGRQRHWHARDRHLQSHGAEVYTTAGSEEKCRALGAGRHPRHQLPGRDFEQVLGDLGMKDRINVILDIAGGDFIQKNINVAAPEGRIVYIAFIRGARAEVNFGPLLMKRLVLTGSTLRAQSFAQKAVMVREILEQVYPHLESGAVKPLVDRIFTLEEAEQAQDYMQSGQHMGRSFCRCRPPENLCYRRRPALAAVLSGCIMHKRSFRLAAVLAVPLLVAACGGGGGGSSSRSRLSFPAD